MSNVVCIECRGTGGRYVRDMGGEACWESCDFPGCPTYAAALARGREVMARFDSTARAKVQPSLEPVLVRSLRGRS